MLEKNKMPPLEHEDISVRSTAASNNKHEADSMYKGFESRIEEESSPAMPVDPNNKNKLTKELISQLISKHNRDSNNATSCTS